ncbi:hypothetical protein DRW03_15020 [Corallococcus sp. H22C18031201]|nr:hypothetical protein DRW03_15020 [Corallococcus sp. H22C18031201]
MEPLSAVLSGARLKGSISAAWELHAPWGMVLPEAPFAAFHLVEQGECWVHSGDGHHRREVGELAVLFGGRPCS